MHLAMAMGSDHGRTLTPRQAAEIWFGTHTPSADQIRKVYAKMQAGALPLNDPNAAPAHWTTNEQALARYLAARRAHQEAAQHGKGKRVSPDAGTSARPASFIHRGDKDLRDAYANVWQDYFRAVMGRRRSARSSRAFERAVLVGQFTGVVIIGLLVAQAFGVWSPARPREERLIVAHLADHHGWHEIEKWHPFMTDAEGHQLVRVEYRYRDGDTKRVVHTDRTFVVQDDQVTERPPDDEG
jgi:hypothetical protein